MKHNNRIQKIPQKGEAEKENMPLSFTSNPLSSLITQSQRNTDSTS